MTYNPLDMTGKRILITGASAGIGRATALTFSRLGASVLALGRDQDRLEETLQTLPGQGHSAHSFDLNRLDDIASFLADLAKEHGPLSGLVHAAGVQHAKPLRVCNASDFDEHYRVNVVAGAMLLKGLARRGVAAPKGSAAVLVGSVMSMLGSPGMVTYSTSKAALVGLVRTVSLEFAPAKIRVNAVLPALVDTPMARQHREQLSEEQVRKIEAMHPLGFGTPEDVAHALAFLVSDASRWITGTCMFVDGGYSAQ